MTTQRKSTHDGNDPGNDLVRPTTAVQSPSGASRGTSRREHPSGPSARRPDARTRVGTLSPSARAKSRADHRETHQGQTAPGQQLGQIPPSAVEARFRALVEVAGQIVWTTNVAGTGDDGNGGMAGWCAYTGQRAADVEGWGWLSAVHPEDRANVARTWAHAIAGRERYESEYRLRRHDGVYREFAVHGVPVLNADGSLREWVGMCVDITESKRVAAEHTALLARERDAARHLRALQAVTETALAHLALDDLMPCLLDRLLETLAADHAVILLLDDDAQSLSVRAERGIAIPDTPHTRTPLGRGIAGQVAARREPLLLEDLATVEVVNPHVRERLRSLVGVPLLLDDAVIGVVLVGTVNRRRFTEDDARLLERAAERVGLAIGQARHYEAQRRAREEAAARAAQLAVTIESMADGVIVHDGEGRMLQTNSAARSLLGMDATPEVAAEGGAGRWTLRDGRGRALSEDRMPLFRVLRGETLTGSNAVDVRLTTHDGREVELSLSAAPVLDAARNVAGGVLIFRDVTERRHLERRTSESLHALLAMAEALVAPEGDGTPAATDDDLPAAGDMSGAQEMRDPSIRRDSVARLAELTRSVLGCERVAMLSLDSAARVVALRAASGIAASVADARLASFALFSLVTQLTETQLAWMRAGEPLLVELAPAGLAAGAGQDAEIAGRRVLVAPLRLRGELVGLLVIDDGRAEHAYSTQEVALAAGVAQLAALVIERERLLREYAEAQASEMALRAANRQMDDFLSMASHELRTPLTSVKAYIQVAQRRLRQVKAEVKPETPAAELAAQIASQVEAVQVPLERANAHSDVLNRLVGDLLDASRIQAGRLDMRFAPCDLCTLVSEVVEEQQLAWPARTIATELETELDAEPEGSPIEQALVIEGDAGRLKQVIANYLTNALKYAPADQPIVVGLAAEAERVRVYVRDHGPGLPEEEQAHIWDRFHRSAGVRTQNGTESGLGLGLYICRGIIELHGGTVGVESIPGRGSTFSFTLPRLINSPAQ